MAHTLRVFKAPGGTCSCAACAAPAPHVAAGTNDVPAPPSLEAEIKLRRIEREQTPDQRRQRLEEALRLPTIEEQES